jgi:hypothetical protein
VQEVCGDEANDAKYGDQAKAEGADGRVTRHGDLPVGAQRPQQSRGAGEG